MKSNNLNKLTFIGLMVAAATIFLLTGCKKEVITPPTLPSGVDDTTSVLTINEYKIDIELSGPYQLNGINYLYIAKSDNKNIYEYIVYIEQSYIVENGGLELSFVDGLDTIVQIGADFTHMGLRTIVNDMQDLQSNINTTTNILTYTFSDSITTSVGVYGVFQSINDLSSEYTGFQSFISNQALLYKNSELVTNSNLEIEMCSDYNGYPYWNTKFTLIY